MPEKYGRPWVGLGGSVRARVATVFVLGLLAFSAGIVAHAADAAAAAAAPAPVAVGAASGNTTPEPTATPDLTAAAVTSPAAAATITSRTTLHASGEESDSTAAGQQEATTPDGQGYWLVASDGGIFTFGDAGYFGSAGGIRLNQPIVGMATTPDGQGYWLVASDGGIFTFGDAGYFGSAGGMRLNQPIVGMAVTSDGRGYWLVASDGGIFTFGDAGYYGSTGALRLNEPIVGMAATPDGRGYWLVASDGGIFTFGDAGYYGSTGALRLNEPIVGMATTPDAKGYWLVASDGGIFTFGDAGYFGSAAASDNGSTTVALASASNGQGYWVAGSNGSIDPFGAAPSEGSMSGRALNRPIVGFAAAPQGIPGVESPESLSITTSTLPNASVGVPYGGTLVASGGTGPYSWTDTAGTLPAGLDLTSSGTINGIPSSPGHSTFTLEVTDSSAPVALVAKVTLSITVGVAPLTVATKNLPSAMLGTPYQGSLTAAGGTSPDSWALYAGALPAGLSLSSSGIITGTPSQQGSASFTVQVVDSSSPTRQTATATLSIPVFPPSGSTSPALDSSNWSGYVEFNGPFSEVTGTFSVPSLSPTVPSGDQMSVWVGIDGGNGDKSLIQAGFNETPDPGSPTGFIIQPWWEILPASETYINSVEIQAGDHVTVAINQVAGTAVGHLPHRRHQRAEFHNRSDLQRARRHRRVDCRSTLGRLEGEHAGTVFAGRELQRSRFSRIPHYLGRVRDGPRRQCGVHAFGADRERLRRRLRPVRSRPSLISRHKGQGFSAPRVFGAAENVRALGNQPGRTARSCHSPGTPLSVCRPRSSKAMPDPTTRSRTVPVARTPRVRPGR